MRRSWSNPAGTTRAGRRLAGPALLAGTLLLVACSRDGRELRPPSPDQNQTILTTTTSSSVAASIDDGSGTTAVLEAPGRLALGLPWGDEGVLSAVSTCKGIGTAPAITWAEVPAAAQEMAITVTDDTNAGYVHWVVAGLDPATGGLDPGVVPAGAVESLNSAGSKGWTPPCPPAGTTHRYRFTLYALSAPSGLTDGAEAISALAAVQRNVLALDVVFGTFGT